MPEQNCIGCHFLIGIDTDISIPRGALDESLPTTSRLVFRSGYEKERNLTALPGTTTDTYHLKGPRCQQGIWFEPGSYGANPTLSERQNTYKKVFEQERRGQCYFLPYEEGMSLDTAKDLWSRQEDYKNETSRRGREDQVATTQQRLAQANLNWARIVTIATVIAAVATAVQVYLQFTKPMP